MRKGEMGKVGWVGWVVQSKEVVLRQERSSPVSGVNLKVAVGLRK